MLLLTQYFCDGVVKFGFDHGSENDNWRFEESIPESAGDDHRRATASNEEDRITVRLQKARLVGKQEMFSVCILCISADLGAQFPKSSGESIPCYRVVLPLRLVSIEN